MVKKLFLLLLIVVGIYVARESYFYVLVREKLPEGTRIGNVDVSQLSLQEAGEAVAEAYAEPIVIYNETVGEEVPVVPSEFEFTLDLETMLAEVAAAHNAQEWWVGFVGYLLKNPIEPIEVDLVATHNVDKAYEVTQIVADLVAVPAVPPRLEPGTFVFMDGQSGYSADIDTTVQQVVVALYTTDARRVEIPVTYEEPPPLDFDLLETTLRDRLIAEQGLLGSIFIKDLHTGEEISINGDLALSGMSIVKIPILLETYRAIETATFDQQKLINETAVFSGNFSANLLLDVVAGQDNAYLGVDILSESMDRLGLHNTFIVTPYEEPSRPGRFTKLTPANSVEGLVTNPDPSMQTTAEDMGALLAMIYDCSLGGGALLALYPGELTAEECQSTIDVLALNTEGNLIRFGVPEGVVVSHKHGWATNTHGDAGIVFSPNRAYVIITYLTQPATDWLVADYSFPILREMSRTVYNYFNTDAPYLDDPLAEIIAAEEAAAAAAEAEAAQDADSTFDFDQNALEVVPEEDE